MNLIPRSPARRGPAPPPRPSSKPAGLRATAGLVGGTLLLAAGAVAPVSAQAEDEGADIAPAYPPAHFVLSITPQDALVPAPTTTAPSPTFTISPPTPTETITPPILEGEDEDLIQGPLPPPDRLRSARVVLACNPDAGTHPDPRRACSSLREVNGYFERLKAPDDVFCTLEYAPVKVEAIGYWGERKVSYTEVFSNRCFAAVGTNYVFSF